MNKNILVWELTAISIYLASSLLSACSAATIQNECGYYNMLLEDDSSVEVTEMQKTQVLMKKTTFQAKTPLKTF